MHITIYKPGEIPVPPELYGGGQRAVYWLCKGLLELGHQVTLIANSDSQVPGAELRPLPADDRDPKHWVDLVPDTTDFVLLCHKTAWLPKKPFLFRHGGNAAPVKEFHPNTVFLSRKHAANHGSRHFIHNGLDLSEYSCAERREDYAVFLAKSRWDVKNLDGAITVARRAGVELRVLGSRSLPLNAQKLMPAFRGVRYYGMTGGEEKRRLLSRARCLIFPVRWHEPFGIAVIEALASGNYVAATPYGSLPEIVTPETGVLSEDAEVLTEAVRDSERFHPIDCRNRVLKGGFTHLDMARKYLASFEQILTHGSLLPKGEPAPKMVLEFNSEELLPWNEKLFSCHAASR
jgi:glycosyltransferase involved in cell wall biosynthesis